MPSRLPGHVRERLGPIRLLVLDVDGVLTDGILLYGPGGEAVKQFSVRDGLASACSRTPAFRSRC